MKNLIRNEYGNQIPYNKYATIDQVHKNNISEDDIRFILNARSEKRRAKIRKKKAIDFAFFIIGIIGFYCLMAAAGVVEQAEQITWNIIARSVGHFVMAMLLWGLCLLRQAVSEK